MQKLPDLQWFVRSSWPSLRLAHKFAQRPLKTTTVGQHEIDSFVGPTALQYSSNLHHSIPLLLESLPVFVSLLCCFYKWRYQGFEQGSTIVACFGRRRSAKTRRNNSQHRAKQRANLRLAPTKTRCVATTRIREIKNAECTPSFLRMGGNPGGISNGSGGAIHPPESS